MAAALDRALALNPNAAHAWLARGQIHAVRNEPEAAIEAVERARRLSPFDPYTFRWAHIIGFAHLAARRFAQAIEWADRALHDQPRSQQCGPKSPPMPISAGSTRHAANSVECSPPTPS